MTEGVLPMMVPALAQAAHDRVAPAPGGGPLAGGLPSYRVYRCRDGRMVAVAAVEDHFQQRLADGLGLRRPLTEASLERAFREEDRDTWVERLGHACVTPVLEPVEVLTASLHVSRGAVRGVGRNARVVPPLGGACAWLHDSAPQLGEHTAAVLAEVGWAGPEAS